MLLHEFDPSRLAVINPTDIHRPVPGCPRVAVSCFERHTFERLRDRLGAEPFASDGMANLEILFYRARYQGREIALFNAYVGAAGCVCVDMECAAVAALAWFRNREVFQFFHGADSLDGESWDRRGLGSGQDLTEKDRIAQLALELAAEIA